MKRGIIITTSEATKPFLKDCLASLGTTYPVIVVGNNGYSDNIDVVNDWNGFELGGILRGMELFDEFIYLPDTVVIKDPTLFERCFEKKGGVEISPSFLSYIGKFDSEVCRSIGVPKVNSKREAVNEEFIWTRIYMKNDPDLHLLDDMLPLISDTYEMRHGRNNQVIENKYLIKYKGTWDMSQVPK